MIKIIVNCEQTVQLEDRVDCVPALADHRTGGQIFQSEILEQLTDQLGRQVIDAGGRGTHFEETILSIFRQIEAVELEIKLSELQVVLEFRSPTQTEKPLCCVSVLKANISAMLKLGANFDC